MLYLQDYGVAAVALGKGAYAKPSVKGNGAQMHDAMIRLLMETASE
ncbi:MAG: hypothetical protein ACLR7D_15580 [Lachnospira eligens]